MTKKDITIQAKELLKAGKSKATVCKTLGIDPKTLNSYLSRSRKDGDDAVNARREYSLDDKFEIIQRIKDNNTSVNLISAELGIPAITIRRWVRAFDENGLDGLKDKRIPHNRLTPEEMEDLEQTEKDCHTAFEIIKLSLQMLDDVGNDFGKTVPDTLLASGAFQNEEFLVYLISFYRCLKDVFESPDWKGGMDFTHNQLANAHFIARINFSTIPYHGTHRAEAEKILEMEETKSFWTIFADFVPVVLMRKEENNN